MPTSRRSFLLAAASSTLIGKSASPIAIESLKTPGEGVQPQAAVDSKGVIHLVYLYGNPAAADIGYVRKAPGAANFSTPLRVNDRAGSAIALGTVRGAQLAIGKSDTVHVAWNGSVTAQPKGPAGAAPMLYTRLNNRGDAFEPQRSLMTLASGLDGGGSLAADAHGRIYVAWHAQGQQDGKPVEGEGNRRVWLARSTDNGVSFEAEQPVSPGELGACGCCGMGALADHTGNLYLLYRTARDTVHRDMYLLISQDGGKSFRAINLQKWQIAACPMSTVSLATANGRTFLSWETDRQVYYAAIDQRSLVIRPPISAPGIGVNRKHPAIATNANHETLLVWTEGTGWKKGGSLAWQLFDASGTPLKVKGTSRDLPPWDFATALPLNDRFLVIS